MNVQRHVNPMLIVNLIALLFLNFKSKKKKKESQLINLVYSKHIK